MEIQCITQLMRPGVRKQEKTETVQQTRNAQFLYS